jgi:hypothetical protein
MKPGFEINEDARWRISKRHSHRGIRLALVARCFRRTRLPIRGNLAFIRAAFRSDFDEDHMVAEPRKKRLQPLLTPRPPIPSSTDYNKRPRRNQLMQGVFPISAEANLDSDFMVFETRIRYESTLAILQKIDRHARLIQRQAERNHFGDDQTHPCAQILSEGCRGLQSGPCSFRSCVNDDNLQARVEPRPEEGVLARLVVDFVGRLDSHRGDRNHDNRGALKQALKIRKQFPKTGNWADQFSGSFRLYPIQGSLIRYWGSCGEGSIFLRKRLTNTRRYSRSSPYSGPQTACSNSSCGITRLG